MICIPYIKPFFKVMSPWWAQYGLTDIGTCFGILVFFWLTRSHSSFVISAQFGINFPLWFTVPMNLWFSIILVGMVKLYTLTTLSGLSFRLSMLRMCPKNSNDVLDISYFEFRSIPSAWIFLNVAFSLLSHICWSFPDTIMSSMIHISPSLFSNMADICFWYISLTAVIPNGKRLNWYLLNGAMNVVSLPVGFANIYCSCLTCS